MSNPFVHELQFGDVYVTPLLVVGIIAFFATVFTVVILNKTKLSKWVFMPQYVFLAIMTLYVLLIDKYFIRF